MQDATNILEKRFYIDDIPTVAVSVWITDYGDVYVGLKHPKGGTMNVNVKHIRKYIKHDEEYVEL